MNKVFGFYHIVRNKKEDLLQKYKIYAYTCQNKIYDEKQQIYEEKKY